MHACGVYWEPLDVLPKIPLTFKFIQIKPFTDKAVIIAMMIRAYYYVPNNGVDETSVRETNLRERINYPKDFNTQHIPQSHKHETIISPDIFLPRCSCIGARNGRKIVHSY